MNSNPQITINICRFQILEHLSLIQFRFSLLIILSYGGLPVSRLMPKITSFICAVEQPCVINKPLSSGYLLCKSIIRVAQTSETIFVSQAKRAFPLQEIAIMNPESVTVSDCILH